MSERDCEKCKHHTEKGCDSWDCKFERRMTREEAIEHAKEQLEIFGGEHREFIELAIKALEQEPNTGHWISFGTQGEIDGQIVQAFTCSECGAISIFRVSNGNIVNGDLCPNCGAKMEESEG